MKDIQKELESIVKEFEKLKGKVEKALLDMDKQQEPKTAKKPTARKAVKRAKKGN